MQTLNDLKAENVKLQALYNSLGLSFPDISVCIHARIKTNERLIKIIESGVKDYDVRCRYNDYQNAIQHFGEPPIKSIKRWAKQTYGRISTKLSALIWTKEPTGGQMSKTSSKR